VTRRQILIAERFSGDDFNQIGKLHNDTVKQVNDVMLAGKGMT
jgi:hypothetical protein